MNVIKLRNMLQRINYFSVLLIAFLLLQRWFLQR